MKKIFFTLILCALLLTGCEGEHLADNVDSVSGTYPRITYNQSMNRLDIHNRIFEFPEGYILSSGYAYELVETESGFNMIFHLVKKD